MILTATQTMPPPPTPVNGHQHLTQPHADAHALHERQHLPVDPHLHGLRIALGSILSPVINFNTLYCRHRLTGAVAEASWFVSRLELGAELGNRLAYEPSQPPALRYSHSIWRTTHACLAPACCTPSPQHVASPLSGPHALSSHSRGACILRVAHASPTDLAFSV